MASRRFIQKFDRLSDDAQRHLETQADLFLEMGHRRPPRVDLPRDGPGRVLAFPASSSGPTRVGFFAALSQDPERVRAMLKAMPKMDERFRTLFSFRLR